jgi:hypothetical protein
MYGNCEVLSLQDGVLTLAVPSSAVAAKLKQQLPKLQAALQKKGWQVESVRDQDPHGRRAAGARGDEAVVAEAAADGGGCVRGTGGELAGDAGECALDCGAQEVGGEAQEAGLIPQS